MTDGLDTGQLVAVGDDTLYFDGAAIDAVRAISLTSATAGQPDYLINLTIAGRLHRDTDQRTNISILASPADAAALATGLAEAVLRIRRYIEAGRA